MCVQMRLCVEMSMHASVHVHGNQSTELDANILPHALTVKWPCIIKQGQNVKYNINIVAYGLVFHRVFFYSNKSIEGISLQVPGMSEEAEEKAHSYDFPSLGLLASPLGHTTPSLIGFLSSLRYTIHVAISSPYSHGSHWRGNEFQTLQLYVIVHVSMVDRTACREGDLGQRVPAKLGLHKIPTVVKLTGSAKFE